jgi:23S rRNA (cytosine1962-C5)-methyltransferase
MLNLFLKKGREAPVLRGHPWIFSGAIEKVDGDAETSPICDIFDGQGRWLARGLYNPKSQIRVRVLTWTKEPVDQSFFARRLSQAAALRAKHVGSTTNAYRVVNGEGDFLPGLVVDRYADFLVCQFLTAGMDALREEVVGALQALLPVQGLYERSEGAVREQEELPERAGVLAGVEPPALVEVEENGIKFAVDLRRGQKTGLFLDQRENRLLVRSLARGQRILNCFAYTGGFAAYAFQGEAKQVISLESSRAALELGKQALRLNGLPVAEEDWIKADAFSFLKNCTEQFDMVILDPPSLARRRADVEAAAGGYKYLNLHALRLL